MDIKKVKFLLKGCSFLQGIRWVTMHTIQVQEPTQSCTNKHKKSKETYNNNLIILIRATNFSLRCPSKHSHT